MNRKRTARLAGVLFLLATVAGGFGLSYIRTYVIVTTDAELTVANLLASELWFRAAVVGSLLSQVFLLFFGLTMFRLFREVDRWLATVFLAAIMITVGIAVFNQLNNFEALLILSQSGYLKVFSPEQLKALAMNSLRLANGPGQGIIEIFWTPYYFAFGLLMMKSRFAPKLLGVLLMSMAAGFSINLLDKFLIPQFHPLFFTRLAMSLGAIGGVPTMLWLLIKGVRDEGAV
jgi:Domain of unknown function (DUF4386)